MAIVMHVLGKQGLQDQGPVCATKQVQRQLGIHSKTTSEPALDNDKYDKSRSKK